MRKLVTILASLAMLASVATFSASAVNSPEVPTSEPTNAPSGDVKPDDKPNQGGNDQSGNDQSGKPDDGKQDPNTGKPSPQTGVDSSSAIAAGFAVLACGGIATVAKERMQA